MQILGHVMTALLALPALELTQQRGWMVGGFDERGREKWKRMWNAILLRLVKACSKLFKCNKWDHKGNLSSSIIRLTTRATATLTDEEEARAWTSRVSTTNLSASRRCRRSRARNRSCKTSLMHSERSKKPQLPLLRLQHSKSMFWLCSSAPMFIV